MPLIRRPALAVFLGSLLSPALAAEPSPRRTVTWDDCAALAFQNNPALQSARRVVEASRASYYGSFNGVLPQVNLTNGYSDGSSFTAPIPGSLPSMHWQAGLSASMNLFSMGQIAQIKSAAASLDQAEASYRLSSSNLRLSLRQAFIQLLDAQESLDVDQRIRAMRDLDSQMVTLRYDSGRESKGNMLRAKALYYQADASVVEDHRQLRAAQKALDQQLGLDEFEAIAATGTLDIGPLPELGEPRVRVSSRPDVAVQEAAIESAEASVKSAQSDLWPSLTASYSRTINGTGEFPSTRYGWTFLGLLSYPLFGGGPTAAYYSIASAKRGLEKSRQDLRSVMNAGISDIENSWSSLAGAIDQVNVAASLLAADRQRNDEADVRYASGLLTYDNWEIIVSNRVGDERQILQARLNAASAEASWLHSLGRALGENP